MWQSEWIEIRERKLENQGEIQKDKKETHTHTKHTATQYLNHFRHEIH